MISEITSGLRRLHGPGVSAWAKSALEDWPTAIQGPKALFAKPRTANARNAWLPFTIRITGQQFKQKQPLGAIPIPAQRVSFVIRLVIVIIIAAEHWISNALPK